MPTNKENLYCRTCRTTTIHIKQGNGTAKCDTCGAIRASGEKK